MNADAAVLIAGAGPAGLMLAGELALAGVDALVLERLPAPREAAMGMAINSTVVELLAQRGIMDELAEEGMEWPSAHFAHIWLEPSRLPEARAFTHVMPQATLERHLEKHALKLGARVRRAARVVGLRQDGTGVTVEIEEGGRTTTVRGRYLVGCDGADSAVRKLAGIEFPGTDHPFYGLIGELDLAFGEPLYEHIGSHQFGRGLFNVTPSGPQVVRVTTGEFGVRPADSDAAVTIEELRAQVAHIAGVELPPGIDAGSVRWLARWHHRSRQASHYRDGRVFLAGNAAHVHFPLGGQALSTDLEDTVNLGWKLAAVLRGSAGDELLDSYHAERHPVGERVLLTTEAQVVLMSDLDRVGPLRAIITELAKFDEVNSYFVRLAGALDVRYPAGDHAHPLTGQRLVHAKLTTPSGTADVPALLAAGQGLLLNFSGATVDLTGWTDRVRLVTGEPVPEIGAGLVLLRPDGRVAWAGEDTDSDLTAALSLWFGEPIGA